MVNKCTIGEASPLSLGELDVTTPLTLDRLIVTSIESPNGTQVNLNEVFLSSGWDVDASATIDTGSTDQRGIVRITVGTNPTGSPYWTLTYGTPWSAAPFAMVTREGSIQPVVSSTASLMTVTQTGALAGGSTIVYHYSVL